MEKLHNDLVMLQANGLIYLVGKLLKTNRTGKSARGYEVNK